MMQRVMQGRGSSTFVREARAGYSKLDAGCSKLDAGCWGGAADGVHGGTAGQLGALDGELL
jgi:hypothetical protein